MNFVCVICAASGVYVLPFSDVYLLIFVLSFLLPLLLLVDASAQWGTWKLPQGHICLLG
jgi:hypothetical protein